jgi:hypothetical protein
LCSCRITNIVAINFFYDVPVKIFSSHLLLIALFIVARDLPRFATLLLSGLPLAERVDRPFWRPSGRRRLALGVAHLAFVGLVTASHVGSSLGRARSSGFLKEASPLAGVYRVESFERSGRRDREIDDSRRWVRVGLNPPATATVQRATGVAVRMRLALDEDEGTLSVFDRGETAPDQPHFRYREVEPGVLRLEGAFEGGATTVVLRRVEEGSLLMERGFRWVNEYPFNR